MPGEHDALMGQIRCPRCPAGAPGEMPHFYEFVDASDAKRHPSWLLGFVCENHHHWAIQLDNHNGGMWVSQQEHPCPNPEECWWGLLQADR